MQILKQVLVDAYKGCSRCLYSKKSSGQFLCFKIGYYTVNAYFLKKVQVNAYYTAIYSANVVSNILWSFLKKKFFFKLFYN